MKIIHDKTKDDFMTFIISIIGFALLIASFV